MPPAQRETGPHRGTCDQSMSASSALERIMSDSSVAACMSRLGDRCRDHDASIRSGVSALLGVGTFTRDVPSLKVGSGSPYRTERGHTVCHAGIASVQYRRLHNASSCPCVTTYTRRSLSLAFSDAAQCSADLLLLGFHSAPGSTDAPRVPEHSPSRACLCPHGRGHGAEDKLEVILGTNTWTSQSRAVAGNTVLAVYRTRDASSSRCSDPTNGATHSMPRIAAEHGSGANRSHPLRVAPTPRSNDSPFALVYVLVYSTVLPRRH